MTQDDLKFGDFLCLKCLQPWKELLLIEMLR